ncbi:MAG TPA: hydroxymethylpyrimidine/phosphomethylpyrimidine kinase [Burkholderiales bacterium]|nr:hydroxymethylpyrimidine/phosphomethylpyrimidine kinase [Burkholderiales bacterium]
MSAVRLAHAAPPLVLTFAATDPTCGAGAHADVLAIGARGCHPLSVVTALTVQDTRGVHAMHALEPALVTAQARALLAELPVAAFKLGVLGSAANATAVASILAQHADVPVVMDPVLASGRGDPFADEALVEAMRRELLPLATVLTPNTLEARRVSGEADLEAGVRGLLALGCRYVLLTGTHDDTTEVVNSLYGPAGLVRAERWPRLPGSYHGSGCTLAAALAAALARGLPVEAASHDAQAYTWQALQRGFRPAGGQSLPVR